MQRRIGRGEWERKTGNEEKGVKRKGVDKWNKRETRKIGKATVLGKLL